MENQQNRALSAATLTPCLWFDGQAEEAANFYTGIFKDGRIKNIIRYGQAGQEIHGHDVGAVMVVEFEIKGMTFTALNGGPLYKFSEAISFQVRCASQEESDYYWEKLTEGGDEAAQQCGWLKDIFGVTWQVYPEEMLQLVGDPTSEKSQRAMSAMLEMKRIDLAAIKRAYDGDDS